MERDNEQTFWHKMLAIDRRILYSIIFVFVAYIVLFPIGLPVPISAHTENFYSTVEAIPEGGIIWLDCAFQEGSWGELGPMVEATMRHSFNNNIRVVLSAMWELGGRMAAFALDNVLEDPAYEWVEYGEDVINLGFRPGGAAAVLRGATRDVYETYAGVDHDGNPLDDYTLGMEVERLHPDYVDFSVVYESGSPGGQDWLQYVTEPTGLPMGIGIIAMSIPSAAAFVDAGQYEAMIPGGTGAAEYELLLDQPGEALAAQDVLSVGMLYVTLLIILGNIAWVATKDD